MIVVIEEEGEEEASADDDDSDVVEEEPPVVLQGAEAGATAQRAEIPIKEKLAYVEVSRHV